MKKFLSLTMLVSIGFASCVIDDDPEYFSPSIQKEPRLVQFTKTYSNGDTYTSLFTYNENGSIKKWTFNAKEGSTTYSKYIQVNRNSEGMITELTGENIHVKLFSDPQTKQYKYGLETVSGLTTIDSIVYVYNGGKIAERINYTRFLSSPQYNPAYKTTFEYDGNGNIITSIYSKFNSGAWQQQNKRTFTYDDKINPLANYNENILLHWENEFAAGKNNILTETFESYLNPGQNYNESGLYTYSDDNRPLNNTITNHTQFFTRNIKYTYD